MGEPAVFTSPFLEKPGWCHRHCLVILLVALCAEALCQRKAVYFVYLHTTALTWFSICPWWLTGQAGMKTLSKELNSCALRCWQDSGGRRPVTVTRVTTARPKSVQVWQFQMSMYTTGGLRRSLHKSNFSAQVAYALQLEEGRRHWSSHWLCMFAPAASTHAFTRSDQQDVEGSAVDLSQAPTVENFGSENSSPKACIRAVFVVEVCTVSFL